MPEPDGCEAWDFSHYIFGRGCGQAPHFVATYTRECECWPETKVFCPPHGARLVGDWLPPQEKGICNECGLPIQFVGLAVITDDRRA